MRLRRVCGGGNASERCLRLVRRQLARQRRVLTDAAGWSWTGTRREKMGNALSNMLALVWWRNFRFLHGGLHGDVIWLLIGVVLLIVVIWALSRRKRRWF